MLATHLFSQSVLTSTNGKKRLPLATYVSGSCVFPQVQMLTNILRCGKSTFKTCMGNQEEQHKNETLALKRLR